MSNRYIAFLRAINVGGHTVTMDRLRQLVAGMGGRNVETFIASGNVIFDSDIADRAALERHIAAGLEADLGYPVATFIRTPAELVAVAARWPFEEQEQAAPHTHFIAFLAAPPDEMARVKLSACNSAIDAFHIDGREVYWLRRDAIGQSTFSGALLEKTLGQAATLRNSRTVAKLAAKYA